MSSAGPTPSPPPAPRARPLGSRLAVFWTKEIWRTAHLQDASPRGWFYAVLRVLSITFTVFMETKIPSRAAALSFSSILGLGPLLAIGILVGGFVLGNNGDPKLVVNKLNDLLHFIAPQLQTLEEVEDDVMLIALPPPPAPAQAPATAAASAATAPAAAAPAVDLAPVAVNPELIGMIEGIIASARSGSAGVFGALSLIFIVLLLFKAVEDAFNDIWGVRQGRSLLMRVVFYWTILTLGAVLFFAAVALLGAGAFVNVFVEKLPFGSNLVQLIRWLLPVASFSFVALVLMLVYRVIPNTRVFWRAALIGALVVATLMMLNNFVALFYARRVLQTKSLYGSLALPLVLMLGLYVFWLYVLIGGVISYAVQNVHFRNSQAAWSTLSESMRERLSLVVLLTVCRRFHDCLPPISASQLGELLKVPTQVVNECLNRLVDMRLVATLRPAPDTSATEHRFQPARPLNRINLYDFKTLDDNFGDDPIGQSLERIDPLLSRYDAALASLGENEFFRKNLDELLAEAPFDSSRPPFALGERTP